MFARLRRALQLHAPAVIRLAVRVARSGRAELRSPSCSPSRPPVSRRCDVDERHDRVRALRPARRAAARVHALRASVGERARRGLDQRDRRRLVRRAGRSSRSTVRRPVRGAPELLALRASAMARLHARLAPEPIDESSSTRGRRSAPARMRAPGCASSCSSSWRPAERPPARCWTSAPALACWRSRLRSSDFSPVPASITTPSRCGGARERGCERRRDRGLKLDLRAEALPSAPRDRADVGAPTCCVRCCSSWRHAPRPPAVLIASGLLGDRARRGRRCVRRAPRTARACAAPPRGVGGRVAERRLITPRPVSPWRHARSSGTPGRSPGARRPRSRAASAPR